MNRLSLLALLTSTAGPSQAPAASHYGLVAGREWVYAGSARWTSANRRVRSTSVKWVMQCLVVRSNNGLRAALVRGWVHQLAWHAPGDRPGFTVLVEQGERLYVIDATDSTSAADSLTRALASSAKELSARGVIIDSGLVAGRLYGGGSDRGDRADALYAWHVEGQITPTGTSPWRGLATSPSGWRLAYRTLPDHVLMDFVPGVGITRYVYSHHGTVADTDVRLIAIRDGRH